MNNKNSKKIVVFKPNKKRKLDVPKPNSIEDVAKNRIQVVKIEVGKFVLD